jgi:hypothetical protein
MSQHISNIAVGFFAFGMAAGLLIGFAFGNWSRGVDEQEGRDF